MESCNPRRARYNSDGQLHSDSARLQRRADMEEANMRASKSALLVLMASAASASAQVVQLPSFHSFSVDTTVVVPDSGPSAVASQRAARSSQSQLRGLPGSRAIGRDRQAAGAAVRAQVHDPEAAEGELTRRALAARGTGQRTGERADMSGRPPVSASRADPSRAVAALDPALPSVAEIKRARLAQQSAAAKARPALSKKGGMPATSARPPASRGDQVSEARDDRDIRGPRTAGATRPYTARP